MEFQKVVEKYNPDFAFAYGSGVFRQEGYSEKEKPMVDFIFGVNSVLEWHRKNMQENPEDYSSIARILGANFIEKIEEWPAGVYYNPNVDFNREKIKYGVISRESFLKDLREWNYLYVAGRLHKPVLKLKSDLEIDTAIKKNLEYALNVALSLLPEFFSEKELYTAITSISYIGDIRMKFAENSKKIENIVNSTFDEFQKLYRPIIKESRFVNFFENQLQQTEFIFNLPSYSLPEHVKSKLNLLDFYTSEKEKHIQKIIYNIIKNSSTKQTLKGFFSAGFFKSMAYAREKIKKAIKK